MAGLEPGCAPVFYVLKNGLTIGPVSEEELRAGMSEGRFGPTDLVHVDGQEEWQPLERIFGAQSAEGLPPADVPDWKSILQWAGVRLRYSLTEQGKIAAPICVGFGAVFLVLSQWPILFWLPWFLGAAFAGVLLIRRKQPAYGAVVLVTAVCVPWLLQHFATKPRGEKPAHVVESISTENHPAPVEKTLVAVESPTTPAPVIASTQASPSPESSAVVSEPDAAPAPVVAVAPSVVPVVMAAHYGRAPASAVGPAITPAPSASSAPSAVNFDSFLASAGRFTDNAISFLKGSKSSDSAPSVSSTPEPDLMQSHRDSYVIVKGANGSGSGFICRMGDKTWFFSNIHVMAEIKQPVATRLDNTVIIPGQTDAAAGADIVRSVIANPPAAPLEAMTNLESNAHIGDEVVVLGNSGGGGVVTRLRGKILGIGPDRIEVNAEFIPGNSGSPIIHVKSGKVIGIATYLTLRYEEFSSGSSDSVPKGGAQLGRIVVRRFGYRLDKVSAWEPVNWATLHAEADQMEAISGLTQDIYNMLGSVRGGKRPLVATAALRQPYKDWTTKMENSRLHPRDRAAATESFLNALRLLVRGDVMEADARFHYTYFRDRLHDEQKVRDRMYQVFDRILANRQSALNAPAY